ncbi:hypothetical protein BGZ63DRAFT_468358 [Mariannaea sp. PMI_226]|nr:hypothetical protein BGZ63DRAFT_468358 [Mariannaea sp. PMI_226]
MPPIKALAAPLLISILAVQGLAQDLDETIVGCDAVQCPLDNHDEPHCKVENTTFQNIGLTRIPDVPDSLNDFSIVKGVGISGPNDDTYTNVYYLGTPQYVSLDEVYGCAVLFQDPPEQNFPQNGTGTCSDVINHDCIVALQDLAVAKVTYKYVDGICKVLQESLEESKITACENFAGRGKGFGSLATISISNLTNIQGKDNVTSDCWPILPKSANLAPLYYDIRAWDGGPSPKTAYNELHRITPILTLFMTKYNSKSVVTKSVSRLSCIKINGTWTGDPEDVAPRLDISGFAVLGALVAFALIL